MVVLDDGHRLDYSMPAFMSLSYIYPLASSCQTLNVSFNRPTQASPSSSCICSRLPPTSSISDKYWIFHWIRIPSTSLSYYSFMAFPISKLIGQHLDFISSSIVSSASSLISLSVLYCPRCGIPRLRCWFMMQWTDSPKMGLTDTPVCDGAPHVYHGLWCTTEVPSCQPYPSILPV